MDGLFDRDMDGLFDGDMDSDFDGLSDNDMDGESDLDGDCDGLIDGESDLDGESELDGDCDELMDGESDLDGDSDGLIDGDSDGLIDSAIYFTSRFITYEPYSSKAVRSQYPPPLVVEIYNRQYLYPVLFEKEQLFSNGKEAQVISVWVSSTVSSPPKAPVFEPSN